MTKQKLIILAPSYLPNTGGVEKHIFETVHLLKESYAITILVRYSEKLPELQTVDGVRVYRLPRNDSSISIAFWVIRHLRLFTGAKLFHSHDYFLFSMRRLFRRARWVHTFHGYEGYPLLQAAIDSRQRVQASVDICIGVGSFIEKWYGTPCDEIIYGAAEIPASEASTTKKWDVLFYGRLEPDAGIKAYLEGFKILSSDSPKLTMLVIGAGSLGTWAHNYVSANDLAVTFVGPVSIVDEYILASKVAFVAGYLAIIENAARSTPIVAIYETPIKLDYLTMHPIAEDYWIVSSPEEVATAAKEALGATPQDRRIIRAHDWAKNQTWRSVTDLYESKYSVHKPV